MNRLFLRRRSPRWGGLALAATLAMLPPGSASGDDPVITVVTSRDGEPYSRVVAGIEAALSAARRVMVERRSLEGDSEGGMQALRSARSSARGTVITVGSSATRAALEAKGRAPVIACMMVDAGDLGEHEEATGVMLEFPPAVQLQWVRSFLPDAQTVGVLYNPEENRDTIAEAQRAAARLDLRLVAHEIQRPEDLPGALESLAREVDVLLAVTDRMVLSPQTARAILLFTFRNRLPFVGLSASWVKAGALYALERDYEDLGAQCADMALRVQRGTPPSSIPVGMPRKVTFVLNVRTAEHLRLRLPPSLVEDAAEVFR